jgi:RimJ/RimL family protein N-acetyltransferase
MASLTPAVGIQIRPFQVSDAALVCEAVRESMSELQPWMPWCHSTYALEDSRSWLESQVRAFSEGTAFEFAIVSLDGRFLGGCGLNQIDRANGRANLGYWVRTAAANQGVATRAVQFVLDWGFRNTELIRFEVVIAVGNIASLRVAEKSGALREGTLKHRLILHGESHDAAMFSFTREMKLWRVR